MGQTEHPPPQMGRIDQKKVGRIDLDRMETGPSWLEAV